MGARVVISHADPVTDAGQVGGGFAGVDGPTCQFRGNLTLCIPDDVLVAIYRSHSGDGFAGIARLGGQCKIFLEITWGRPSVR